MRYYKLNASLRGAALKWALELRKQDSNSTAPKHNVGKRDLNSSSNLYFIPYLPQPLICWLMKNIGISIVRLASAKP